ncbi:MAG: PspC domain-containing protein [Bacteroidota bacterium]
MKKNFTVNICGTIFNIDEDAYELLNQYLLSLKEHYINEEGRDEILSDIESRIAEMLIEKTESNVKVVTIADIESVISIMGQPDEFEEPQKASHQQAKTARRLFRDPDNKMVGGVCSGIGAYFNMDKTIIRILFIVAIILGLSGVLVYLILWIAIPEAKTTVEKLEMRGEKINLNNIEKNIKEEFSQIKDKVKEMGKEAKAAFHEQRTASQPTGFERFFTFIFSLIKYFVRALGIFIGLIFIIVGLFILVGIIAAFFGAKTITLGGGPIISSYSFNDFLSLFMDAPYQITLSYIGLSLFIGVPLIMLIYNGIKIVLGSKSHMRYIGISAFTFWFAGLIICIILSIQITKNYSNKTFSSKKIAISQPSKNVLSIEVNQNTDFDNNLLLERKQGGNGPFSIIAMKGKDSFLGIPKLEIANSENDSFQVIVFTTARGASLTEAEHHIANIKYNLKQLGENLVLDPVYQFSIADKWRAQDVKIIVKIPEGRILNINPNARLLFKSFDNEEDKDFKELYGRKWIMTHTGLKEYFEPKPLTLVIDSVKTIKKIK